MQLFLKFFPKRYQSFGVILNIFSQIGKTPRVSGQPVLSALQLDLRFCASAVRLSEENAATVFCAVFSERMPWVEKTVHPYFQMAHTLFVQRMPFPCTGRSISSASQSNIFPQSVMSFWDSRLISASNFCIPRCSLVCSSCKCCLLARSRYFLFVNITLNTGQSPIPGRRVSFCAISFRPAL